MEDLIKALQIFLKYGSHDYPTVCSHECLTVVGIKPSDVAVEDIARLEKLGFDICDEDTDDPYFLSFKYGCEDPRAGRRDDGPA